MVPLRRITLLLALCVAYTGAFRRPVECPEEPLDEQLNALADALDADGDQMLWDADDSDGIVALFDANDDGCVSRFEWIRVLTSEFDLGNKFAYRSFPVDVFNSCPLNGTSLQANGTVGVDEFLSQSLEDIAESCRPKGSFGRFRPGRGRFPPSFGRRPRPSGVFNRRGKRFAGFLNRMPPHSVFGRRCECSQVADLCRSDAQLSSMSVCEGFSACVDKGTLAQRFQANLAVNDADGDGVVRGPEIIADFTTNYDTNNDGCVTVNETIARFVSGFNFSAAFGAGRFENDPADPCPMRIADFANMTIPVAAFTEGNLEALVRICEGLTPREARGNCDCQQLKDSCENEATFQGEACDNYLQSLS